MMSFSISSGNACILVNDIEMFKQFDLESFIGLSSCVHCCISCEIELGCDASVSSAVLTGKSKLSLAGTDVVSLFREAVGSDEYFVLDRTFLPLDL